MSSEIHQHNVSMHHRANTAILWTKTNFSTKKEFFPGAILVASSSMVVFINDEYQCHQAITFLVGETPSDDVILNH